VRARSASAQQQGVAAVQHNQPEKRTGTQLASTASSTGRWEAEHRTVAAGAARRKSKATRTLTLLRADPACCRPTCRWVIHKDNRPLAEAPSIQQQSNKAFCVSRGSQLGDASELVQVVEMHA
jgi:hypothetical protein